MMCPNPILITKNLDPQEFPGGLLVPCGKCLCCRIKKRNELKLRLWHEMSYWEDMSFITLTYSDENLPKSGVIKTDLQKFFKRLRKKVDKIKYLAVGEYGGRHGRAHYHAILYGVGLKPHEKKLINETWGMGITHSGSVTPDSIVYVCKYISKSLNDDVDYDKYNKPFRLMSLGLGRQYCLDNAELIRTDSRLTMNGRSQSVPRYYIKKLDLDTSSLRQRTKLEEIDAFGKITGLYIDPDIAYYIASNETKLYLKKIKERRLQNENNIKGRIAVKGK